MDPYNSTLAARLWPWQGSTVWRGILLVVLGTALLWISAKINVPFYPVPMTMQPFVVFAIGLTFGSRLAVATVLLYLLQGAAGLPVFAGTPEKGLGLAYMAGPTGGYLLGFVLAAGVVGALADRGWDRSMGKALIACLIGVAAIHIPGLLWLGTLIGWDKPVLALGFTPFILGDLVKALLVATAVPAAWGLLRRWS
jgi:biotin transport system substrate-specific component